MTAACTIDGCQTATVARGYCSKHYTRWARYGDPLATKKLPNGTLRNWIKLHAAFASEECLIWPFSRKLDGRPQMNRAVPCRLMCEIAKGCPPTPAHEAAHSCGKGHLGCINPRHLYWATHAQNIQDKVRHGTIRRGERAPTARLTDEQVRVIKSLKGHMPIFRIAAKFDVSSSCIGLILNGHRWRHVS